ncbi:fatty acid--CoA ligase [Bradyrhizobium sp. F1.13.3]|uniref:fatty acid--CoA ligase n=1 Tax=Bradyrhizobium sp. F1.13.3 TaxID=3156351 RepID=UPI00339771E4
MNQVSKRGNEQIVTKLETLADVPRFHAAASGTAVAISFEGRSTTYADLQEASSRVANGLRQMGVGPGDRVAVLDRNVDRFFEIWLGAAKCNAVIVPVNARLAPPEVAYIVKDSSAKVLFIGESFAPLVDQVRGELQDLKAVIVINEDYQTWRNEQEWSDPVTVGASDDVCMQLYTSGTTGHPKGVQLTNRNILSGMADTLAAWGDWSSHDVALVAMPLFHIAGCGLGMLSLVAGLRVVLVREFAPEQVISLIEKERITVSFLVPAMIKFILEDKSIAHADVSSVRCIVYGASPIPLALLQSALSRFKSTSFIQIYGLTETTGGITVLSAEDHRRPDGAHMRSCGRPITGVELRIEGADGAAVKPGEVGEILCRTVKNMKGYWNRDAETTRTLRDGWLRTGDAGYVDANGYLFIHDRVKDMIVSGGENIYPAEVESAIFGHPAVADVAVIGVPDERWGEAVKAVIVLKSGQKGDSVDILNYARERIAGYKVPKSIDYAEALPRNPTGKILKRELRKKYWKGYERQVN